MQTPVFDGHRLRELRVDAGLKREELALAVGIGAHHLAFIECGRRGPSLHLAVALARYFGVHVEELFEQVAS